MPAVYCAAFFCNNSTTNANVLSFFRFPRDKERSNIWLRNVWRKDLETKTPDQLYNGYRLCSDHFSDAMFLTSSKNKLIAKAYPDIQPRSEGATTSLLMTFAPDEDSLYSGGKGYKEPFLEGKDGGNLFADMCRLCASDDNESPEPIVSSLEGQNSNLIAKLCKYLPFMIIPNDGFPMKVCSKCVQNLTGVAIFIEECIKTQTFLKNIIKAPKCDRDKMKKEYEATLSKGNYFIQDERKVRKKKKIMDEGKERSEISLSTEQLRVSERIGNLQNETSDNVSAWHEGIESQHSNEDKSERVLDTLTNTRDAVEVQTSKPNSDIRRKSFRDIHIRTHTSKKPYMCSVCNQCFSQRSECKKHVLSHYAKGGTVVLVKDKNLPVGEMQQLLT